MRKAALHDLLVLLILLLGLLRLALALAGCRKKEGDLVALGSPHPRAQVDGFVNHAAYLPARQRIDALPVAHAHRKQPRLETRAVQLAIDVGRRDAIVATLQLGHVTPVGTDVALGERIDASQNLLRLSSAAQPSAPAAAHHERERQRKNASSCRC